MVVEKKKISLKSFKIAIFSSIFIKHFAKIFYGLFPWGILYYQLVSLYNSDYLMSENYNFIEGIKETYFKGISVVLSQGVNLSLFPSIMFKFVFISLMIFIAIVGTVKNRIKNFDKFSLRKQIIKKGYNLFFVFLIRLAIIWVVQATVLGFIYSLQKNGPYKTLFIDFLTNIFGMIIILIILGIISGLYNSILECFFITQRSPNIYKPYNRLISSLIFDFIKLSLPITIIGLFLVLVIESFNFYSVIIIVLMGQCLSLYVFIYSSPLFKHLTVRIILFFQKKAPFHYRTFLNKVSKTGLMEKDGGQWRFRHQLIQDWFARQYTQQ